MLFKSQLVTQASGSIGGTTFARNRYGLYQRSRAIPVNPNSPAQVARRANFSNLAQDWRGLTDAQRQGWKDYAAGTPYTNALGDEVILQGNAMFQACLTPRILGPVTVTPGTPPSQMGRAELTTPTAITLSVATGLAFAFTNTDTWATAEDGCLLVYMSPGQSPGVAYFTAPFRFTTRVLGAEVPPTSPATQATALMPFPVVQGRAYFFRFLACDALQRLSTPVIRRVVAGA